MYKRVVWLKKCASLERTCCEVTKIIPCILGSFEGSSWETIRNQANQFGDKIKQELNNETQNNYSDEKDDRNDILHQSDKTMRTALFVAFLLSSGIFAGILFSADKVTATNA